MEFTLSNTVKNLEPSGIRRFFELASSMDEVISLGVGEPDFVTPWHVREACVESLEKGYTAYTANAGLLSLREAVAGYMRNRFSVSYDPGSEVLITVGASQALDVALRTIINPGDEVLIIDPSFVAYGPLVTLAGGVPVRVQTSGENGFKVTVEQLEQAVTEKTKAVLICFPNNPTGTMLDKEELQAIANFVRRHHLLVLSDEIYAELSYDEAYHSFASIEGMWDHTIVISGFSKGFAMTGWRLGFIAAPECLLEGMLKVHQYSLMCAPTMSQYAALEALKTGSQDVEEMRRSYKRRRNFLVKSLNEAGLTCHLPGGAFYAFPSIKSTGLSSEEFAEKLLMQEKVAVVPGNVFGECGEGYIRCSYATSMEQLIEAMNRINKFIQS